MPGSSGKSSGNGRCSPPLPNRGTQGSNACMSMSESKVGRAASVPKSVVRLTTSLKYEGKCSMDPVSRYRAWLNA